MSWQSGMASARAITGILHDLIEIDRATAVLDAPRAFDRIEHIAGEKVVLLHDKPGDRIASM